jgi:hypothetical protein
MTLPHNSKPFVIPSTGRNTRHSSCPGQDLRGWCAQQQQQQQPGSGRKRVTLDGREHDGSFARLADVALHRDGPGSTGVVEQFSARKASLACDTSSEQ